MAELRQNISECNHVESASYKLDQPLRVAVLMGGTSSERAVSLATGRQIVESLNPEKYTVTSIDTVDLKVIGSSVAGNSALIAIDAGIRRLPGGATHENDTVIQVDEYNSVPERGVDVVFIALHGKGGEDGSVQGMLEVLGLPYTGSGVLASALAMNKTMSKRLFAAEGIPVIEGKTINRSGWVVADQASEFTAQIVQSLGLPVFVKPNAEGSTVGCTLVEDASLLKAAIDKALKYDDDVLIEQYISGTEITVGVLEDADGKITCLPPVEIVPKGEFYDYESKYAEGGSEHVIPARIGDNLTSLALNYAARCHALLHCRGMSRTDMIASASGLYVLEVNTIPGMTPTSLLPQAAASVGISFSELLDRIINSAIGRKGEVSGRPEDAIKQ